jgi:hypothetical protein
MNVTVLEKKEVFLTEMAINKYVTLVQMPDMVTYDLHVEGDNPYLVHFLNPNVFGQEFATLRKGYNLFTMIDSEEVTECHLFDDVRLRNILAGAAYPRTGPIVIPPRHSGG